MGGKETERDRERWGKEREMYRNPKRERKMETERVSVRKQGERENEKRQKEEGRDGHID